MNSIVAEKRYIANKLGVPYESLSQSYLRTQTKVSDAGVATVNNVIDFTLQTNKVLAPAPTDRLLDLNDEFVITHFTMGLKGVEVYPAEDAFSLVHTSDQPVLFTGAYTEYLHKSVGAIYNGDLNFTIDRTEFIPQFPVRAFYRVGDGISMPSGEYASNIPALDPSGAGNAIEIGAGGSVDNRLPTTTTSLYGFYPCEPTKIDGRQTLDLSVNLGTNVSMSDEDSSLFVVFEARGYLITNAND